MVGVGHGPERSRIVEKEPGFMVRNDIPSQWLGANISDTQGKQPVLGRGHNPLFTQSSGTPPPSDTIENTVDDCQSPSYIL